MQASHNTTLLELPVTGFLRFKDVQRFIPVSSSTWWKGVREGIYPQPVRLSTRTTAWRAEDIHKLINRLSNQASNQGRQ
ncbi:transcriptional regulator [Oceanidesulfovibrio marinus]|uniref:Transcriptional regulator n=2 Tax=Oceanidesulfovibrio marinus TaxID=370038 RepID=A0A6P1ZHU6_9BACT|nr:transcriptional regulator [Oceanidesulfovibrio marinus]